MSKRYWVESVDGEEIGDYGGFTYEDELRLVKDGYYESHHEVQRLQIVVMNVESVHAMAVEGTQGGK